MIALVAAMDEARLIGVGGRLPWHSPADLAHFRYLTVNRTVVMGRKTYESIGGALKGRTNVVISHYLRSSHDAWWTQSLEHALNVAAVGSNVFIIGGASIYAQTLPMADRLYLTRIRHTFPAGEGAVYFPTWSGFRLVESKHREADAQNPWAMDFERWERG